MNKKITAESRAVRYRRSGAWTFLAPAVALLALGGCAVNPATGEPQLSLISEAQEVAMGKSAAAEIKRSIGLYPDPELQRYVSEVGMRIAAQSERPDLPWEFAVVDDNVVNAFALPGGHIFVTRGILAHFNSEAELSAVLGHEIGHVTGRHSVEQISKAQLAQLGLGLGSIVSPWVRQFQGLIGQGMELLFLKYGRDAEREADQLGLGYMRRTGYDLHAALDVFTMLDRQGQASGREALPNWLSTHPAPTDRRVALAAIIGGLPAAEPGRVDREEYLRHIDDLVYGNDPRQGYFADNRFVHPELGFQLSLPDGWQAQNLPEAVVAKSADNTVGLQLTLVSGDGVEAAAQRFYSQNGVQPDRVEARRINGLPAAVGVFQAETRQGAVAGIAAHIALGTRVYQLLALGSPQRLAANEQTLMQAFGSFSSLNEQEKRATATPKRIKVFTVDRPTTIMALAATRKSPVSAARLALLNGVSEDDPLPAERMLKWVR